MLRKLKFLIVGCIVVLIVACTPRYQQENPIQFTSAFPPIMIAIEQIVNTVAR